MANEFLATLMSYKLLGAKLTGCFYTVESDDNEQDRYIYTHEDLLVPPTKSVIFYGSLQSCPRGVLYLGFTFPNNKKEVVRIQSKNINMPAEEIRIVLKSLL